MPPEPQSTSFDRERWQRALADIAEALGKEGPDLQLCLIGSAACLFGGMDGRTSRDLDIWKPASDYDLLELKKAVDIQFLYKLHQPDPQRIKQIIDSFPASARQRASENLIYLEILK